MVEQGLGMSIMPELLLKGRHDRLQILPLIPEARRTIGIAIAAGAKAGPATRRFADYVVRYVREGGPNSCSLYENSPLSAAAEQAITKLVFY